MDYAHRHDSSARSRGARVGVARAAVLMAFVTALAGAQSIAAQSDLDRVLATLEGSWEGEGELLDRPATFAMTWERALDGRFLRLEFRNAFADVDPIQPVLESHAYYLLGGPALTGQWMDSRGVILTLKAEVVGSTLVTYWTGEESGRTEYRVIGEDALEVTDYVQAEGGYYPFAQARYRRVSRRSPT